MVSHLEFLYMLVFRSDVSKGLQNLSGGKDRNTDQLIGDMAAIFFCLDLDFESLHCDLQIDKIGPY